MTAPDATPRPLPVVQSAEDEAPRARDTLPVSEAFVSIQGEGKLAGVPSWFVRTSGCNLRCRWCDTPYASWTPEGRVRPTDDLQREAEDAMARGVRHAVVTGGEPMLFAALTPFTRTLREMGMHVTIETAGTVDLDVACDLMSISPKLASSTPETTRHDLADAEIPEHWTGASGLHERRRLSPHTLRALLDPARFADRQLKFVVTDRLDEDLREIEALLDDLRPLWTPSDVLLMPEGVEPTDRAAAERVAGACLARGWRYCPRLHIALYGNTRGT